MEKVGRVARVRVMESKLDHFKLLAPRSPISTESLARLISALFKIMAQANSEVIGLKYNDMTEMCISQKEMNEMLANRIHC